MYLIFNLFPLFKKCCLEQTNVMYNVAISVINREASSQIILEPERTFPV